MARKTESGQMIIELPIVATLLCIAIISLIHFSQQTRLQLSKQHFASSATDNSSDSLKPFAASGSSGRTDFTRTAPHPFHSSRRSHP